MTTRCTRCNDYQNPITSSFGYCDDCESRIAPMDVKYPEVTVQLTGEDGNVFAIIGRIGKALRRAEGGVVAEQWYEEARSQPTYDDVLQLAIRWVDVE